MDFLVRKWTVCLFEGQTDIHFRHPYRSLSKYNMSTSIYTIYTGEHCFMFF